MSWYHQDWGFRQKISIDHTKVADDHNGFVVAVEINDSENPVFTNANANGYDLLVTVSDGVTKIPHERSVWDITNKLLVLYFKAPSLSASADTEFYLYYGNAAASDQQDVSATWSDYSAVYHFEDDPGGGTLNDSLGVNDGAVVGGMITDDLVDGPVGSAWDFDGSTQYASTAAMIILWISQLNSSCRFFSIRILSQRNIGFLISRDAGQSTRAHLMYVNSSPPGTMSGEYQRRNGKDYRCYRIGKLQRR